MRGLFGPRKERVSGVHSLFRLRGTQAQGGSQEILLEVQRRRSLLSLRLDLTLTSTVPEEPEVEGTEPPLTP